jgi:filamentous hemagglutinin family protein
MHNLNPFTRMNRMSRKADKALRLARRQSDGSARRLALAALAALSAGRASANPSGMTINQGVVSATTSGSRLDITASHNAVIDWQQFNIAAGETTAFHQPGSMSVVWNRIFDANPSQIWGRIEANGHVVLMNEHGFYFGPGSCVEVGGFVATTVMSTPSVSAGGLWQFQGTPPAASIINYGEIKTASGGSLFLVAEKIENQGLLSAPDGTLGLYAGKNVLISERPDGRGLSVKVSLPSGAIDNNGRLVADAGLIALHAQAVNQNGIVQANSIRQRNGVIELVAEDVNLGTGSILSARGGDGVSTGGSIKIDAGTFHDASGSRIEIEGGAAGGNGGRVEICAEKMDAVRSRIDGTAASGFTGGSLLLDPDNIMLVSGGSDAPNPDGSVNVGDRPGETLWLDVNSAFYGLSQIRLQANNDISLGDNTIWNLNQSTGVSDAGSLLTLEAGRDILFGNGSSLVGGAGWSVRMSAGVDFSDPSLAVRAGAGGIYLNGGPVSNGSRPENTGSIETANGSITLQAGSDVLVAGGFIRTVNGGSIRITALSGDVDPGSNQNTYDYSRVGYRINAAGLGGIGTAKGGNVTIQAGRDIVTSTGSPAFIGAFGAAGGNVTLEAGRDIRGQFMLRNGTGNVTAGSTVGSSASPLTRFGLVKGTWNITAARDVILSEVFNPNGALNDNIMATGAKVRYQYDYAANASVNLTGGNSVQLLGTELLYRGNADRLPIYAPRLSIAAGAGGVVLGNDVVLYPSAQGALSITTTGGGSLVSRAGGYYRLIVSDSDNPDYTTFADGHASSPVHAGGSGSGVSLNISGSIKNVFLRSPMQAAIDVAGSCYNFSFEGQNLSDSDTTSIRIGGDYLTKSDRLTVDATGVNMTILTDPVIAAFPALANQISYRYSSKRKTKQLVVQGILTASQREYLRNPWVYVRDPATGKRMVDENGNYVTEPATFASASVLDRLFALNDDVPASSLAWAGIRIGGPGTLNLSAANLDLGTSSGIRSEGPLSNPNLASISANGAKINVSLSGNLEMNSSQIASFNGGDITVNAAGTMNIGSQVKTTSDDTPKGIYTAHGGNLDIHAGSDINLNGSRIATYDGGNISVISDSGNVNAGSGGLGFFYVTTSQINDETGEAVNRNDRFFGSGIMALTRTDGQARVGDITVKAGKDIVASDGGILQLAFNRADQSEAAVTLVAGGSIRANQSGILGMNVSLSAQGSIEGLVVANRNLLIDARQNVSVTALAAGTASVTAGQSVSGSIVGGGDVSVSGSEIDAAVMSARGTASTSGDSSKATVGMEANSTTPAAQRVTEDTGKAAADKASEDEEELRKRKGAKKPTLARPVGRVTVILPGK